jgi:UDP-glucose 4-epimerase
MTAKTNILITGGLGFVGSAVIKYLSDNYDFNLVVIDNLSAGELGNIGKYQDKISLINADIRDKDSLEKVIKNCEYVIHLAANVSVQHSIKDPIYSNSVNIVGFLNVLELSKKYKVKKLVYASSAAVYGSYDVEVMEDFSLAPESPYGFEKMADEYYAKFYNKHHGLNCLGLRYFNIYGPFNNKVSEYAGVVKIFIDKVSNNEDVIIYGNGLQERDFILVDDVAKATVSSLFSDANGVLNVATGHSVTLIELLNTINEVLGKNVGIKYLPEKSGDLLKSRANIKKLKSLTNLSEFKNIKEGLSLILKGNKLEN